MRSTASNTLTKRVYSGAGPSRITSGGRKSPTTSARSTNAWHHGQANGWATETCAPRRSGSLGLASVAPSGSRRSATRSTSSAVSRSDLAHSAAMPADSIVLAAASTAKRPSTGGVPVKNRAIPASGS
jgi:hypothetical protein